MATSSSATATGNGAEMPASLYFSDDEHFNKKLQNGVSATTLFDDAMNHHRHQQHEYMFQQRRAQQEQQQKNNAGDDGTSPSNGNTSPNSRRQSVGSALTGFASSPTATGRGANAFLQNNNNNNTNNNAITTVASTSSATNSRVGTANTNNNNNNGGKGNSPAKDLGVMTSTSHLADFPNISMDDPLYSSTITMLKRTKAEISQLATELSAANMINELPTSEDVRRIVAKIFADPRNAEAISESEWKRREQSYMAQRDKMAEKINDHLQQEKAALQEEIKRLGMDS